MGHYGYIKLTLPVFHIGYFRPTINMLSCICKVSRLRKDRTDVQTCARILLTPAERATYLTRFRRPGLESLQRQSALKAVINQCKKCVICPYCGQANGVVKKSGPLKISHEAFRNTKTKELKKEAMAQFATITAENKGLIANLEKLQEDLNPLKVLELFKRVTAEVSTRVRTSS